MHVDSNKFETFRCLSYNTFTHGGAYMEKAKIILSANAGICITLSDCTIWIDALHRHKTERFSTVTKDMWEEMKRTFPRPDILFFTHKHPDHYSTTLIKEAMEQYPKAKLISPNADFENQLILSGKKVEFKYKNIDFSFIKLIHEGRFYHDTNHYGVILEYKNEKWLIAGDCEVCCPDIADHFDYVFLPFPWITLSKGRKFIEENIKPKELFVYHIPFEEDNNENYREAVCKSIPLIDSNIKTRVLQNKFDKLVISD